MRRRVSVFVGPLMGAALLLSCTGATAETPPLETLPMCERVAALPEGASWSTVGRSVEGRPIVARRARGDGPRVLWIGGVHGDETEGRLVTDGLFGLLDDAGVSARVDVLQVRVLNPDGTVRRTRVNAHGVDLNRNLPSPDYDPAAGPHGEAPLSEPESVLLHDLLLAFRPDLVIAMHSARLGSFVNFDGPALDTAIRWFDATGMPVIPSEEMSGPTPGSFGSWAGRTIGVPVLTVELRKGMPTSDALALAGPAAVAVVGGATRAPEGVAWPTEGACAG